MSEHTISYLLIGIISFDFVLERILHVLNDKSAKKPIPSDLEGIYDEKKYKKSQDYLTVSSGFSSLVATFGFMLTFLAIYLGWFGWLDEWIRTFSPPDMLSTLIFFGILFIVSDFIGIPFSLYRNFVIEEKFGFNKMTIKTFIFDKIKGCLLTIIIGGILLAVLIYMVNAVGSGFWIYFWMVMGAFSLFANMFYASLILPLFNKLKPLEEGDLKRSISGYSEKVNFPLKNIFVMDGSKRSGRGNAFFSGLGEKKKVVLFDTLISNHSTEELTAIFAHEVGHYKKKHILISTVFNMSVMGFMLFLFSLMVFESEVSRAMGGQTFALHLNMLAFAILYLPISTCIWCIGNVISRRNEFQADAYAKNTYADEPLITGLKKLNSDHLSNLTPHPAFVFVHYSHPPLSERINALKT